MNISNHHSSFRTLGHTRPHSRQNSTPTPAESVTLGRMSRSGKRKLVAAGSIIAGAAVGSLATAHATSALSGSAAKVVGGTSGLLAGAAVVGLTGALIASKLSDDSGFGGLAAAYGGFIVGGVVGGIGGAVGGAMLGTGAGNVLGYAAGALVGGTLGGFVAKGINS